MENVLERAVLLVGDQNKDATVIVVGERVGARVIRMRPQLRQLVLHVEKVFERLLGDGAESHLTCHRNAGVPQVLHDTALEPMVRVACGVSALGRAENDIGAIAACDGNVGAFEAELAMALRVNLKQARDVRLLLNEIRPQLHIPCGLCEATLAVGKVERNRVAHEMLDSFLGLVLRCRHRGELLRLLHPRLHVEVLLHELDHDLSVSFELHPLVVREV